MPTDKHYIIEQNEDRKFAVRAKGSERASRLFDTQQEAEDYARQLNAEDNPDVERVRNVATGERDKWRKA